MADTKISALTSATTPLAGTEVLPIVQSSTTVKVSVANLTAGRAISATQLTLSTGNLIPATAGKGIDFTANTSAAGMTSELLSWYEEGTWTPNINFNGASVGVTYTTQSGTYVRVGSLVTASCFILLSNKGSSAGFAYVGGYPFAASPVYYFAGSLRLVTVTNTGALAINTNTSDTNFLLTSTAATGAQTILSDTNFSNTSQVMATITYRV